MADGTRLRYDGVETYLQNQLESGVSTVEFTAPLVSDGGAPIDTLTGDEYLALSILDANYRLEEIVHLVAYESGAVTGTIERAQEGTNDMTHPAGNKVVHATTVMDFVLVQDHDIDPLAHPEILDAAKAYTDDEIVEHNEETNDPHPYFVKKTGDTLVGDFTLSATDGDGDPNVFVIEGSLQVGVDAELVVEGDLVINGRLFLNGIQISAGDARPEAPQANRVHIQTYG